MQRLTSVSGKQLVFVTNNSTKSRADYKQKFDKLGIPAQVVWTSVVLAFTIIPGLTL